VGPEHLAYVIYTSGSTGQPKGAMNTHRGICNRLLWMQDAYRLTAADTVLQKTPCSFDVSVWEFFWPLLAGARLVLARPGGHRDPAYLAQLIQSARVSVCHFVPSMLEAFLRTPGLEESCASLRDVVCSGEALSYALQERFFTRLGARLHNLYGPTEAAVDVTAWACRRGDGHRVVPIGRPIANTRLHVLDRQLQEVPVGVPGELYIGSVGLARGYHNRPELTAERFVEHPQLGRLYRTGDVGRWQAEGVIEYLGRQDRQVKVRGCRVELGEVEAALREHLAVGEGAVVAREDVPGDVRLVAYVVPREVEAAAPAEALREHLKGKLPEYMVPSAFVTLEALPLSPNGKLDHHALPAPEQALLGPGGSPVAPRGPVEEAVAAVWAEVLGVERVGIHDNFFDLGGHSLLATRVVARLREIFLTEVPLQSLFENPTVSALAEDVERRRGAGEGLEVPPLLPVPRDGELPLSFAQQRLWFLDQWEPGNPQYNIAAAMHLTGPLDPAALEQSLREIIRRHEVLRTAFATVAGRPVPVIAPEPDLTLPVIDLSDLAANERQAAVGRRAEAEARTPFDLADGPLLRATLLRLAPEEHVALVVMHHIVGDGWSIGVLNREVAALYAAYLAGQTSPLPELPVQYADYAAWQCGWLCGAALENQLAYWRDRLAGAPAALDVPADRPRPPTPSHCGAAVRFDLPAVAGRVRALARREGCTPFMVLLAAFQALLHRYTGQEDLCVGTPVAGRGRREVEGLIGFFVNTLVLRGDLSGDPTFAELLGRVRETCLGAYAHQDLPFERLVEELRPERDSSRSPLFQVMFVLQNAPQEALELPGLTVTPWDVDSGTSKFDLTLRLTERDGELRGELEYSTELFEDETAARLTEHLRTLLEAACTNPSLPVSRLPLLTDTEHDRLRQWNSTAVDYAQPHLLHRLIEQQARRTPQTEAVRCEDQALSYADLDRHANRLAHCLSRLGVGPDVPVAVCLERSVQLPVALLGTLKAGGCYVPLDPDYPADRLAFLLQDAAPPVLLTQSRLAGRLPPHTAHTVCLDDGWDSDTDGDGDLRLDVGVGPEHLAYVIYTSGSTGPPKGAMNSHRGICNRLLWMQDAYRLTAADTVLQKTPCSFDVSVWEFFWPLLAGARLVLARPGGHRDPAYLAQLIQRARVSVCHFVPSMLEAFLRTPGLEERCVSLRDVVCSGEALSYALQERFFTRLGARLHNLYGPTEAAVDVTAWACRQGDGPRVVPIGRPIANTRLHVLDRQLQEVPVGVPGELYIGGVGLARGYHNRPELTAERFVEHPQLGRLYRTGDVGRWQAEGVIEYLGRMDRQVKVRGCRVELGEVEAALREHPAVREAVAVAREETPGDVRLVAYVVPRDVEGGAPAEALREHLKEKLPEYMVPSVFVTLEALPLSPNGKLDHRALPAPNRARAGTAGSYVAPRNPVEEAVARIWAEVLGVERVGIHDNFFDLGGHSLLATQALSHIQQEFPVDIPLRRLFEEPTVATLALAITQGQGEPRNGAIGKVTLMEDHILSHLDQMSDEEVDSMLREVLAEEEVG
jgi:amino acid adenylation domain-containing protein